MSNYTENQYVEDKNNAWNIIFDLVGENKKVLDIGCSSGNFGAELSIQKNCIVDGVEIDKSDVNLAQKKLRSAYQLNVETDNLNVIKDRYDAILMMDVIEHLARPVETLKKIASLLMPDGELIFSVPNMAHISVRLDLLAGEFNYRKTGLLDDTHLHFYTEKYLLDVLMAAGFHVIKTKVTTISYPEQLVTKKLNEIGLTSDQKFQEMIADTKGNVYQFIGLAKHDPAQESRLTFPNKNPHEEHYHDIEEALRLQGEQIASLNQQLQAKTQHIVRLEAQTQRILNSRAYKLARKAAKPYNKFKRSVSAQKDKG